MHCYKLKLRNVDEELKDPVLVELLAQKWEIQAFVPIEDDGEPTLMLFLQKRTKVVEKRNYSLTIIVLLLLLAFAQIAQLTTWSM